MIKVLADGIPGEGALPGPWMGLAAMFSFVSFVWGTPRSLFPFL